MMIADYYIDAEFRSMRDLFVVRNTAVDCDDERAEIFCEFIDSFYVKTVTVVTGWKSPCRINSHAGKIVIENCCARNTVNVTVSEYENFFTFFFCLLDAVNSVFHCSEQKRVVKESHVVFKIILYVFAFGYAATSKNRRGKCVDSVCIVKRLDHFTRNLFFYPKLHQ